jgi:hypothetical protein
MRRIRSPCCARRQRPRDGCAAEQRDELTAVHSITSSARAMSVRGTSLHMSVLQCFQCLQSAAPAGWRSGSMCRHRYSCAPIGCSHEAPRVHRAVRRCGDGVRTAILNLIWLHPTTALALLLVFLYDFRSAASSPLPL